MSVNGFSQKTCLPAAAAATTCSVWTDGGVASTTASTPGSARSSSYDGTSLRPCDRRSLLDRGVTVRVVAATNRIASLPSTDSTSVFPHQPRPTIAALITVRPSRQLVLISE